WVKIKLDHPFYFDPGQSLVVGGDINVVEGEGEGGTAGAFTYNRTSWDSGAHFSTHIAPLKNKYCINFWKDSLGTKILGIATYNIYLDFGFDLIPTPASLEDREAFSYRIYPNPARNLLYIEGVDRVGDYVVYDISGRQVSRGNAMDNTLS